MGGDGDAGTRQVEGMVQFTECNQFFWRPYQALEIIEAPIGEGEIVKSAVEGPVDQQSSLLFGKLL